MVIGGAKTKSSKKSSKKTSKKPSKKSKKASMVLTGGSKKTISTKTVEPKGTIRKSKI